MKTEIIITIIMLFLGTFLYINYAPVMPSQGFFKSLKMKVDFTEKGEMKVFSYANEKELKKLKISKGKFFFDDNNIVLGFNEAQMMKEEKLFSKIGDKINNFFGVDIVIEGILRKTNTIIDDMHFLSETNFKKIKGNEKIFIKISKEGMPKLFFTYSLNEKPILKLKEGNLENYKLTIIDGKKYYPIVIGSDEAQMMISEGLFKKPGDKIDNFFGINVFVVGIVEKTNSIVDMIHFLPLKESELFN
ncbi:MAG: hypothetical protein QXM96_03390 [Candidatus Woesearchaeota archaeon]